MAKIITPGAQPLSLLQWMDAYSMFLESTAEAKNNVDSAGASKRTSRP